MPGLAQKNDQRFLDGGAVSFNGSGSGFWSKHRDDVSYNQLQKFWSELPPQARQELLRIDKQTLFEHARKNMYCSRCNGLLLEGFWQIVTYGKSLQQEGTCVHHAWAGIGTLKSQGEDDAHDPSVHPWGGLTTTRDGVLTLLDSYTLTKSLKGLQNVFDSARARERERELLYPDACGGSGRGWISQGMAGYGRAHGTRETCALHTARLSIDTLVDFWSALGEETRHSLLKMKEEDFIERLMYRFDSKRFCRDCRKNVIREFKELKELKRIKREPRCNSWFCVADTAFQYEVSCDTIQVDWHQTFIDSFGTYHHFEWAVGTGEGKSDILEFENVGLSGRVEVNGLDLSGLSACYITLRAWKTDGRCSEISVKAHSMKGQQCIHCRLVVGDGYVTISRGENIKRFFEHAEEAEEEEDDDSMDKDGSDLDVECTRPQKHAKSPELAREFLLDAATVIFKEQVEKAFREGTARQNAHSIFVCLALKLLEEKVHVACKDIITLEKQMKLLEEEEKEKREEEERKERRRLKEKEKKLRRKERLREKGKDRETKSSGLNQDHCEIVKDEVASCMDEEESSVIDSRHSGSETEEAIAPTLSQNNQGDVPINGHSPSITSLCTDDCTNGDFVSLKDESESYQHDDFRYSRQKKMFWKDVHVDSGLKYSDRRPFVSENRDMVRQHEVRRHCDRSNKQLRSNVRNGGPKFSHCPNHRLNDRYDFHSCSCNQHPDYRVKVDQPSMARGIWEAKPTSKSSSLTDTSKQYVMQNYAIPKNKISSGSGYRSNRDLPATKKVWEPIATLRSSTFCPETVEMNKHLKSSPSNSSDEMSEVSAQNSHEETSEKDSRTSSIDSENSSQSDEVKSPLCLKEVSNMEGESSTNSPSSSDNCSSCLSEGDSNASSANLLNPESSSMSDSEDSSQNSEERPACLQNGFGERHEDTPSKKQTTESESPVSIKKPPSSSIASASASVVSHGGERSSVALGIQPQPVPPIHHNSQNVHFPMFQASTMGYYYQSPVSWAVPPAMSYHHPTSHYVFTSPFPYGTNVGSPFIQYSAFQPMPQPLFTSLPPAGHHLTVLQPASQANGVDLKENNNNNSNTKAWYQGGVVKDDHHEETTWQNGKCNKKTDLGDSGFSLFAFSDPISVKEGTVGNFTSNLSRDLGNGCCDLHHGSDEKDPVEEYNPFANGIEFSFSDIVNQPQ
ncbi:hypothetical protein DM860_005948 [Cuscuta australis]|uniref:Uncharacterized protein n=1 Tax=Cuscuta australis TaxID=267555 RepID=A0A328DSB5_9ASTE|nr:hypothetical protein DM860_005948 [Cuscuta australis]